jgi:hypothetical protein
MNDKEWKRNELFHLLVDKFGLKINEGFVVTGTGDKWGPELANTVLGTSASTPGISPPISQPAPQQPVADTKKIEVPKTPDPLEPQKYDLDDDFESNFSIFKQAISEKESGGDYNIEGVPVNAEGNPKSKYEKGEKARGKYQIMPTNWRAWSKAAGLPEEFQDPYAPGAYSPENQEKVADYQFRYYYNKYNTEGAKPDDVWRKVAIAWYGGEGGVRKVER